MRNVTRSVLPLITVTDKAGVIPVGPPPTVVGLKVTVTLAGGMVPPGNPCPVTLMLVSVGSPVPGDADAFKVTSVVAPNGSNPDNNANTKTTRKQARQRAAGAALTGEFVIKNIASPFA